MAVKATTPAGLGRRIKTLRKQRGLSQEELAQPDYTAAFVSQIEHGHRRPSDAALGHFASRLGVTVEQLKSGRDPNEDLELEIALQQAIARIHGSDPIGAGEQLGELIRRARATRHQRLEQKAEESYGHALYRLGRFDEALGAYARAEELSGDVQADLKTVAVVGRARCLFLLGEVRDAVHLLETHEIELNRLAVPDPSAVVDVHAALIPVYFELGLVERAKESARKGWDLAQRIEDPARRACLYINRGQLLMTQGERREAFASLALANDLFRQLGWTGDLFHVELAKALVYIEEGDLPRAESLLKQMLDEVIPLRADRAHILLSLALVRRRQGDPEGGLEIASQAMKEAGKSVPRVAGDAAREAGLCADALGDDERALSLWRAALEQFNATGHKEDIAKTARLIGDKLMQRGETEAAASMYRDGLGAMAELR